MSILPPIQPLGRKLKVFDLAPEIALIPILTLDLPVDPSLKYDKIVGISKFKPEYRLVGGINMPKLIECIGTDGRVYKQVRRGRVRGGGGWKKFLTLFPPRTK